MEFSFVQLLMDIGVILPHVTAQISPNIFFHEASYKGIVENAHTTEKF